MDWIDIKKALSDFFTPAELVELLDISTEELIDFLETGDFFSDEVVTDLKEIMQIGG